VLDRGFGPKTHQFDQRPAVLPFAVPEAIYNDNDSGFVHLSEHPFVTHLQERIMFQPNGELVPLGGGDNILLVREKLTLGRRESCDICLRFPNISSVHAQLTFQEGYWRIKDLNSTNGIKVNGTRVLEKMLHPKDKISIGKREFTIVYEMPVGSRAMEELEEDVMGRSLLEAAGLEKPKGSKDKKEGKQKGFDPADVLLDE
jgi:FHA domain